MNKFYRFRMSLLALTACLLTPFMSATAYTITTPFQLNDNVSSVTDRQPAYADAGSTYDVVATLGSKPTMTIACISDIHTQYKNDTKDYALRESFLKAIDGIKSEDIDLMIFGGDINNSGNYDISKTVWKNYVDKLKETAESAFSKDKDRPILVVDGNHDYESAGSKSQYSWKASAEKQYNSGDYYSTIMLHNIGELVEGNKEKNELGSAYYEDVTNFKDGTTTRLLAAFHYVINGFDFIGLNTAKYMAKDCDDYNYSSESMTWVINKLKEIDPDGEKTVFFIAHIPFGDSNSISEGKKGIGKGDSSKSAALKTALAQHPNTIMLYGHDHGGNDAYTKEKTSQRVTRYDTDGKPLSGATDGTHVDGIYSNGETGTDVFFSEFMGSMRYYNNYFQSSEGDNYTSDRVLVQGLMIYIYDDRIVFQHKNYGQAPVTKNNITVNKELVPYTVFRTVKGAVENVPVTGITLSESTLSFDMSDNTEPFKLTATVSPENATNKKVVWSSNNPGIATVSDDGVVTPVKPGTCLITATSTDNSSIAGSCTVNITGPTLVKEITISQPDLTFEIKDYQFTCEPITLTATVQPDNATNKDIIWSSSNEAVATVTAEGVVTPTGRGTCTITATAADGSGVTATCTVNVSVKIVLIHQKNYTNKNEMECDDITYQRTFTTTNWQALYVPFRMNSSQWTNDFTIAYISGIHTYDEDGDGTIDRQTVEVIYIKNGTLKPNYPYVIKAKQTGSYEFTSWDNMLYAAEEKSLTCNTTTHDYTFTGIYTPRDYKFLRIDNKAYFFSGGQLKYLADTSTASLLPNSMYLLITPKKDEDLPYDADYTYPKSIEIRTVGYEEDGDVTYIDDVTMDETLEAPMWSIDGRPVNGNDMESLAPGIYVKQGKKILIR